MAYQLCRPSGAFVRRALRSHHFRGGLRCAVPLGLGVRQEKAPEGRHNGRPVFANPHSLIFSTKERRNSKEMQPFLWACIAKYAVG